MPIRDMINMTKEQIENQRLGIRNMPPFPTGLVTVGKGKEANIITVALIHVFSFDPPLIGIGISPNRHSHRLLIKEDEFVVNIPGKDLMKEIMGCGTVSGSKVDKFEVHKLDKIDSQVVKTPSIGQCKVSFECKKTDVFTTGDHDWFIGEVVMTMIEKDYKRDDGVLYWAGEFRSPGKVIKHK